MKYLLLACPRTLWGGGGEKRALPTNESATGRPKSTCNQEEQLVGDGPVAVAVGGPRLPPACRQAGRPQSRRKKWSGGMHAPGPGGEALGDPHRLDARTAHPSLVSRHPPFILSQSRILHVIGSKGALKISSRYILIVRFRSDKYYLSPKSEQVFIN